MRVVWTYRNYQIAPLRYRNKVAGNCEIFSDREFRTFSGCLATWQILAPELTRVLYVDQSVYDFLDRKNILHRFDQVNVVDFEKELDSQWPGIDFFAAPKLWVLTQQTEPFFLVDTETMLFEPISSWYRDDYHFMVYEQENSIRFEHWTPEDCLKYLKLKRELQDLGKYLKPFLMVNAGLTSWPDIQVAKSVGNMMLTICEKVCLSKNDFRFKWTFCEESIIRALVHAFNVENRTVKVHSLDWSKLEFVEWSSPETVPHVYEDFKWWCVYHPNIPVEKLREIDLYAEY